MILNKEFKTSSLEELNIVADYVLENLTKSKVILLNGELGAGKTALIKKIASKLGIKETITSPTFGYMKQYNGLIHMDAYNLSGSIEEFEDYKEDNDILAIEWSNNIDIFYNNYVYIEALIDIYENHIFKVKVVK